MISKADIFLLIFLALLLAMFGYFGYKYCRLEIESSSLERQFETIKQLHTIDEEVNKLSRSDVIDRL